MPTIHAPLTPACRDALLDAVSRFEGPYWAINPDREFEGHWDRPVYDAQKRFIPPAQRSRYRNFRPNPWSKFGPNPGHVGLSFGFVQFTQDGGNLGRLLSRMQKADRALFTTIFGELADELVRVTNLPGGRTVQDDPSSPTGKARRSPRVARVGGHELWHPYWTERFDKAGRAPVFQAVQRRVADALYLEPVLQGVARTWNVRSQKGLCILLDRSVQLGHGGCKKLLSAAWTGQPPSDDTERFAHLYRHVKPLAWSRRVQRILNDGNLSFETLYDVG